MGKEIELKFAATEAVLEKVRARADDWQEITMHTRYLDTPEGSLAGRKWMLRERTENGSCVFCFKMPAPDGHRLEWESEESLEALFQQGPPAQLRELQPFGVSAELRFLRRVTRVTIPGCSFELALDGGCFCRGDAQLPFYEIELELKSGDLAPMEDYAKALSQEFSLNIQPKSKQQRAIAFAKGENHV